MKQLNREYRFYEIDLFENWESHCGPGNGERIVHLLLNDVRYRSRFSLKDTDFKDMYMKDNGTTASTKGKSVYLVTEERDEALDSIRKKIRVG